MPGQQARSNIVLFCVLACLLAGAAAAAASGAALVISRQSPASSAPRPSPLSGITTSTINAPLALGSLSGRSDEEIVQHALSSGQLDTGFATLLYSLSLSDEARTTGLLNLARRCDAAHRPAPALAAARAAIDVAVLSPTMSDHARAAALDQAGQALASLGRRDEAAYAYDQAAAIARNSGRIEPTLRQLLLEGLAQSYTRLGNNDGARQMRTALQSPPPLSDSTPTVLPSLLPPFDPGNAPAWANLQAATEERMRQAATLTEALQSRDAGVEAKRQALETALLAEDGVWRQIEGAGYPADTPLQSTSYARLRLEWQALKWRVASRGFGMSLVPAWEQDIAGIEADLAQAAEDYYLVLRDAAISLPDQRQATEGAVEIVQDQIKLGRLGWPQWSQEADLMRLLQRAVQERLAAGNPGLYLANTSDGKGNDRLTVVAPR